MLKWAYKSLSIKLKGARQWRKIKKILCFWECKPHWT